jgi:hypothetical protein
VIQNWIHTTEETIGFTAKNDMRSNRSLSAGVCADFDNPNYQPKLGGLDRREKEF